MCGPPDQLAQMNKIQACLRNDATASSRYLFGMDQSRPFRRRFGKGNPVSASSPGRAAEPPTVDKEMQKQVRRTELVASKQRPEGRLSSMLRRVFMRRATVTTCEQAADRFHLITLESPDFRDVEWTPGDKLQIALGSAFVARTYTPIEWDSEAGRTRILAYDHGSGPGSDWARALRPGDVCDVFGPRASLDVSWVPDPVFMLGDETSFGLALAMGRQTWAATVEFVFEIEPLVDSRRVLGALDFGNWRALEKRPDDTHLAEIETRLPALAQSGATFVLTGKSTTIQRVRKALKGLDVPSTRLMTKAYWAPGKAGLD